MDKKAMAKPNAKPQMQPQPAPSVGRIVLFNYPGDSLAGIAACACPAIVLKVYSNPEVLNLWVLGPLEIKLYHASTKGEGPNQWSWPPRV